MTAPSVRLNLYAGELYDQARHLDNTPEGRHLWEIATRVRQLADQARHYEHQVEQVVALVQDLRDGGGFTGTAEDAAKQLTAAIDTLRGDQPAHTKG